MLIVVVVAGAFVVLAVWVVVTYNRLVRRRNQVDEGWAGIDVQLQRRADVVPNLVETVKGYRVHEADTLEEVTAARTQMVQAQGAKASGVADNMLEAALGKLFAVAEAYPDLKANANFLELQKELSDLEEEISFARRYYNALVKKLNTSIQTFPSLLIARPMGFAEAEYFKAESEAHVAPTADLA